nr:A/G-specific adenine glycosylase [Lentibacillus saliphilus]
MLEWYDQNKRDLPWRDNQDPYRIWVSEIMLQQTQVDTVIPYYGRFMAQFPTVFDLAAAEEQTVLKAWEGLGYYSRARNLQAAAKEVVASYAGVIPADPKALGSLKGIGPYTKGAILSIAFNMPEPAVDGNVMRVTSRILKIDDDIGVPAVRKKFEAVVRELIPESDPSSFNQALMELGALVCTPKNPLCTLCPVQAHCRAYEANVVSTLPVKSKKKPKKKIPYAVVLIQTASGNHVIEQRPDAGLLANLWQFPMVPVGEVGNDHIASWLYQEYGLALEHLKHVGALKHVFTHMIWELTVYTADLTDETIYDKRLKAVTSEALQTYPFPVSHQKMMHYIIE